MEWQVLEGDCLELMAGMEPGTVDAVVTDPPYGLAFMGKEWDHAVPGEEYWSAAFEVAKPGAHLLAFGGTRLFHHMTVAIEGAGWEIRDCMMWLYGSGFPKSLDVSKAIDKMDAAEAQAARRYRFTEWVRSTGVTARQIDAATGTNMGGHYTTSASQPAIMTREHLEMCRHLFGDVPAWVEQECDKRSVESRNFAARPVVGTRVAGIVPDPSQGPRHTVGGHSRQFNVTMPSDPAARQWQGWGTALKPAWEPIILARKPFKGTVAANVLEHGTGAVNVDGCRVGNEGGTRMANKEGAMRRPGSSFECGSWGETKLDAGRWPANLILDEAAGAMLDEQAGNRPSGSRKPGVRKSSDNWSGRFSGDGGPPIESSCGGASRFFYCPKASKADRDSGLDGFATKPTHRFGASIGEGKDPHAPSTDRNNHPTVKPHELMRYLCRLITPPGGTVLDPFCGSGSTGKAAVAEGFNFIGCELDPDYCNIARERIAHADAQHAETLASA